MSNTQIIIKDREAFLGEHDNCLFAFLMGGSPLAFTAAPAPGGIRLIDAQRGRVLSARPGACDQLCQLELLPADQAGPRSVWEVIRFDDDGERAVQTIDESGVYSLRLAGTQQYLGRFQIEPMSMMPRPVFLLPEGHPIPHLLVLAQSARAAADGMQASAGHAG